MDQPQAPKQQVEIVLISPPAVPTSDPVMVDVHFRPLSTDRPPSLRLLTRNEGRTIAVTPIDANAGVARVEIECETAGSIKFMVQSEDGRPASNEGTVVAVPHNVADQINRVFEDSICGLMDAKKEGKIAEETISVDEWESSPMHAKWVAWRHYFHRLMQDMGRLLDHIQLRRRNPDLVNKPFGLSSTLTHVLVFLLDNHAYQVGDFILGQAVEVGESATFTGMTLDRNDINLEYLHQNMQRQHPSG